MKIVILNNCWLNEQHLQKLKEGNKVVAYASTSPEQIVERLHEADIVLLDAFHCQLTNQILDQLPNLKLIALNSTGFDMLDIQHATSRNIKVCNIPDYASISVAEHTFALILSISRKIPFSNQQSHQLGLSLEKTTDPNFLGFDLAGKSLGLIGVGKIGSKVAQIALGFNMTVFYYDLIETNLDGLQRVTSLDNLLSRCDIISLHLPLNQNTQYILNQQKINLIKNGAIIINTSRGQHIDGNALYDALKSGKIAAAGLDVLDPESTKNEELLDLNNVVVTPHSAWFTQESLQKLANSLTQNVLGYINGKPQNLVN